MFGFFKKKAKSIPIDEVASHLEVMGYELTAYGAGVALLEIESGYNVVEAASHIAFTTMALDIREAGDDIAKIISFLPHREALLKILKEYKDKGMMNPTQWENDAAAIFHISNVDQHQIPWIQKILSDPIAGKQRLAVSRVQYQELGED
ncbi:MAG: hypothetical protein ACAH07_08485 [Methylophilaceae bacterium]|nr:hypothetical protein [Methyloradius sp.]